MENKTILKKLTLNENSVTNLDIIRKWSMFFSILGFIWLGLIAVFIIGFSIIPFNLPGRNTMGVESLAMVPVIIMLIVMGVLYFFPIIYLYKFAKYSKTAINDLDSESADLAFLYLKKNFQFMGILTIVVLALYILMGFFGVIAAIMA